MLTLWPILVKCLAKLLQLTHSQPRILLVLKPRELSIDEFPEGICGGTNDHGESNHRGSVHKLSEGNIQVNEALSKVIKILETVELVVGKPSY